jgi:hypothetical protein
MMVLPKLDQIILLSVSKNEKKWILVEKHFFKEKEEI